MDSMNFNHLYYFWAVARAGSIVRASEDLGVSQPTISLQIKQLERSLRRKLFERSGRRLVLTDAGRVAFNYADEIFSLGQRRGDALRDRPAAGALRLAVGVVDSIPKTVARLLIEPATRIAAPVRLVCREDKAERLLADLAAFRIDVVLSDAPIGAGAHPRGFNHLLGECGVTFFASSAVASRLAGRFPRSLDNFPVLLPSDNSSTRRALDLWFDEARVHPNVVGEFDDAALMNSFGQAGAGAFPVPDVVAKETQRVYRVRPVGRVDGVRDRFYAITTAPKLEHPAVVAICDAARTELFD
jgi:LysR family transcriptional activator of nhaA